MSQSHSQSARRVLSACWILCLHTSCHCWFKTASRLKHHKLSFHNYSFHKSGLPLHSPPAGPAEGRKCDSNGQYIDPNSPPPPLFERSSNDWGPYGKFIFQEAEMSVSKIDKLCHLWGHSSSGGQPPFTDHKELYKMIDAMEVGDLKYNGERPADNILPWMDEAYEYWFHDPLSLVENILANSEFHGEFDYSPYWDFTTGDSKQRFENFMSGDWAWLQADAIARDPSTHGATFVPIILGSDKMTVSVATGQNDYWPVYLSVGNIHSNVQHAHCSGVELLMFLAIPKAAKKYTDDPAFQCFKKQLFHVAMSKILGSLKACMMVPWVMKCPDDHFHRVICGIGPYIADYLEQVLISGIVQNWCGRCTASPDDLDASGPPHTAELMRALIEELQASVAWDEWGINANIVLIKGGFKDHLVEWVGKYLELVYGKAGAKEWLADIDHHIAAAPPFPGLQRFPDGWGFSQWMGNDSKALMKGHVPCDIVWTFRTFLEFCYIVQQNVITEDMLSDLKMALDCFHRYCENFLDVGVHVDGFSLPCQHSLVHYGALICLFGAPNGLCTSITESKHIIVVKRPWQWLSKHNALGQILWTNQCLTQLAAAHADFEARGMLPLETSGMTEGLNNGEDKDEHAGIVDEQPILAHSDVKLARCHAHGHARSVPALAIELGIPTLPRLISEFLYEQLHCEPISSPSHPHHLPVFTGPLKVFHSATATFVSPSDPSGIGSMRCEMICAIPTWHCANGMLSMEVAQVLCFFSFVYTNSYSYPCALIHWFECIADEPDGLMGMWMVKLSFVDDGAKNLSIIHVDSIVRNTHLLPIFRWEQVPPYINLHNSLDIYHSFYVSHFADHHAFELAS
ncbi:hypothetical protein EDD16DRAFT_1697264 [Pisolithus croceorrhizus]|nr:hypothetical protein EDD16DRAFT_1697264 [Pisolithus croceorrhizus]KAI6119479.1 hypothetical protein EV401DRAFT_2057197 [Pisolithus croceorrhizus]KAI6165608.1 hypothetical protein EDD17DRAFT_1774719 [Pisolithus thermaeus]